MNIYGIIQTRTTACLSAGLVIDSSSAHNCVSLRLRGGDQEVVLSGPVAHSFLEEVQGLWEELGSVSRRDVEFYFAWDFMESLFDVQGVTV
jgi:hypothetical protein